MRYWALAGILLSSFLVQSVLGHFLRINEVAPNVVLVVVVAFGLLFGSEIGLGAGMIGGLLLDLVVGQHIGLRLFAIGAVGLAVGLVEERVFKDNILLGAIGGFAGSIVSQSIILMIPWIFGRPHSIQVLRTLLFGAGYDMVFSVLVYRVLYKYYRYLRPDPRGTIVLRRH